jgi:hypothetical protein
MFRLAVSSSTRAIATVSRTTTSKNVIGGMNVAAARGLSTPAAAKAVVSEMPSVYDVTVKLNFLDDEGNRRSVPGLIGKTLWETAMAHDIDIGPSSCGGPVEVVHSDTWTENLYGEGACSGFDHVVLQGPGVETAKPMDRMEKKQLDEYWDADELYPESRLSSQIVLTKAMDGMNIYLPPRICDEML